MKELTLRVVILGAVLSAILSAANAYLGLFAGMTVSASIPAAVLSMGILRVLGGSILENNLVQTGASAGESAAAGAIFTLPALILLSYWAEFSFTVSAILIGLGGVLGVLFTIFLRRALVVEGDLPFPEGVATAEVLRAGHAGGASSREGADPLEAQALASRGLRALSLGAAFGALAKLFDTGLGWSRATVDGAATTPFGTFYGGLSVSPALAAVGHIVGFHVALLIFLGGLVNWVLVLPFVAQPQEGMTALELAWSTWSTKTRYLGVGAMTIGGIGALFEVRHSILVALKATLQALSRGAGVVVDRRERDLPAKWVLSTIVLSVIPLFFVFREIVGSAALAVTLALVVLIVGFLFSAVAAYMAGLVGSSHNPVSGVTIATILFASLLLSFWGVGGGHPSAGPAAAILVGSIVCTAAAIGGDNTQDLKAGFLLGATPWRQQIMQLVGVVVAALVLGPVLQLLLDAYGFGAPSEVHPHALRAPQATLMASVSEGVFGGGLPWAFFFAGVGIGAAVLFLDALLQRRGAAFRTPVLAVALGLYLPIELSVPVLLGGLLRAHTERRTRRSSGSEKKEGQASVALLASAGLITGEALMGICLAGGVALSGRMDFLTLGGRPASGLLALSLLALSLLFLRAPLGRKS